MMIRMSPEAIPRPGFVSSFRLSAAPSAALCVCHHHHQDHQDGGRQGHHHPSAHLYHHEDRMDDDKEDEGNDHAKTLQREDIAKNSNGTQFVCDALYFLSDWWWRQTSWLRCCDDENLLSLHFSAIHWLAARQTSTQEMGRTTAPVKRRMLSRSVIFLLLLLLLLLLTSGSISGSAFPQWRSEECLSGLTEDQQPFEAQFCHSIQDVRPMCRGRWSRSRLLIFAVCWYLLFVDICCEVVDGCVHQSQLDRGGRSTKQVRPPAKPQH